MSQLFSSLSLKDMQLKNRIMMAPMCMFMAGDDGKATEWHYIHYTTRAVGGTGLIMIEATAIEKAGRISDTDLGIWSDDHIPMLKKIVDQCHVLGAKVGIQIGHSGRKAECSNPRLIAPSPIPFKADGVVPKAMTLEEIKEIVQLFKDSVGRAYEAGFDTIEVHAAHGYLISEFLSPLSNQRTDQYGGSAENRARFLKEVLQGVTQVWPGEKPIILRVSADDFHKEGNHPKDLVELINLVKAEGIDAVNVSSGGTVDVLPPTYPGYQIRYAEVIKEGTGLPVIAGGLVRHGEMAEEIIANERGDMVYVGRALLNNPYWPLVASHELNTDLEWPGVYSAGKY